MNKVVRVSILLGLVLLSLSVFSQKNKKVEQKPEFSTVTYFQEDSTQLQADVFMPSQQMSGKMPLYIHVHGGGFSQGDRTNDYEICKMMARNGCVAVTISYTLSMKGKDFGCGGVLTEKIKAIQIAVNQLWRATEYFVMNASQYQIDTTKVFVGGISAGAETALHAAYWDRKLMGIYPLKLSENFRYTGIIEVVGALIDINLISKENMIPTMMFHGDCDRTVPYATAAHRYCPCNASGWLMMFGSKSIFDKMIDLGGTAILVTQCGGNHMTVNGIMERNASLIAEFVKSASTGKRMQMQTSEKYSSTGPKNNVCPICE
jgi:poly(3-hydroxybutyrate) depolymerase